MATDEELRRQAIRSIKKKRDFWAHAVAYCIVNIFLIIVWYLTGHGYFWSVWVMGAWGIGLAFNAWTPTAAAAAPSARPRSRRRSSGGSAADGERAARAGPLSHGTRWPR